MLFGLNRICSCQNALYWCNKTLDSQEKRLRVEYQAIHSAIHTGEIAVAQLLAGIDRPWARFAIWPEQRKDN